MKIALGVFSILLFVAQAAADQTLVRYGFDDSPLPRAEDGFYIFENSKGYVEPSSLEKFSGSRSLELQEAPLDGQFVELQGVVPPIASGEVLFHFAFFVKNPEEELNIAVAGPAHFYMRPDGIIFWLKTLNGMLFYHADGMPKRAFKLKANTWYITDVVFHIDEGSYDLRFLEEGNRSPLFLLKNQPNAINQPASRLSKISFIGDLEDRSSVNYYVDDVELTTLSHPLDLGAEVLPVTKEARPRQQTNTSESSRDHILSGSASAPRIDFWQEYAELKKLELERPQCLPALSLRDFGISRKALTNDATLRASLQNALHSKNLSFTGDDAASLPNEAKTIMRWRTGCVELAAGNAELARGLFREALSTNPDAPIIIASLVVAERTLQNRDESEKYLLRLYEPWATDARLPVLLGFLAVSSHNYGEAAEALRGVAQRAADEPKQRLLSRLLVGDDQGFDELKRLFGKRWKEELDELYIAQGYYYSLLFDGKFEGAVKFANEIATKYQKFPKPHVRWLEHIIDAHILAGNNSEVHSTLQRLESICATCAEMHARTRGIRTLKK